MPERSTSTDAGAGSGDGRAWVALAALLALGAIVVFALAPPAQAAFDDRSWAAALEWRPGIAASQPWRWWTAAFVHWSPAHLMANLLGDAVVAWLGWRARASTAAALAWLCAWPMTQALFDLLDPAWLGAALQRYGGLSGVLHAGATIAGLALVATRMPPGIPGPPSGSPAAVLMPAQVWRHRAVGAAVIAGTLCKVVLEAPWNPALRPNALLGIEVAPIAHACGVVAGSAAFAAITLACWRLARHRH